MDLDFSGPIKIFALWREVAHIGELTGLGLAGLGFCALGLYFGWKIALVRRLLIVAATMIVTSYFVGITTYRLGLADKQSEWDAANKKREAEMRAQATAIAAATKQTFDPIAAQLAKDEAARQQEVAHVVPSGDKCRITDGALRLRHKPAKPAK